uniref:Uncharacterized protein n=1 Tax=Cannabis sativa TaxID=3483 RepID=A0A803Q6W8_CANSA
MLTFFCETCDTHMVLKIFIQAPLGVLQDEDSLPTPGLFDQRNLLLQQRVLEDLANHVQMNFRILKMMGAPRHVKVIPGYRVVVAVYPCLDFKEIPLSLAKPWYSDIQERHGQVTLGRSWLSDIWEGHGRVTSRRPDTRGLSFRRSKAYAGLVALLGEDHDLRATNETLLAKLTEDRETVERMSGASSSTQPDSAKT